MAEVVVKVPEELKRELEEFPEVDWSIVIGEFIKAKTFELELERSRKLRHLLFKALTAESKLTEKDALELGKKIKEGRFKELKDRGLI